jgi:TolB-like protein
MPDIFLSYSRDDQTIARRFAEGLESEGFSVWWDQALHPGEAFDQVTEKALEEARAVVVLWSKISVESRWVRAEATQAHAIGKLVPVMIAACKRPIMFELTQTVDLTDWDGDRQNPAWRRLVAGIRRMSGTQPSADSATPVTPEARNKVSAKRLALAGIAVAVAVLLVCAWFFLRAGHASGARAAQSQAAATAPSIAVLPFANLTSDPEQEYFSDGLTEELLNELTQIQGLRVIGRTSSFAFKGRQEDLRRIGEILAVNHIVTGSVRKSGDRVRINAQLINPADGSQLWSKVYERRLDDIFAIQEEIAGTVAGALRVALAGGEQQQGGTRIFPAYDALLAGRAGLNSNSIDSAATAGHFEQAVALDPNYVAAWIWLIDTYTRWLFDPVQREAVRAKQAAAVEKVVALVPDSTFASLAQSYKALVDGKLQDSDRLLSASLDAAAGLGMRARLRYGQFLLAAGRARDAVETMKQVLAADPLDVFSRLQLILAYEISGDVQHAVEARDALLKLPGGNSPNVRAQRLTAAMARGDHAEVVQLLAAAAASESPLIDLLQKQGGNLKSALPEMRRMLREPRFNRDPYMVTDIGSWAGYIGDSALALEALNRMPAMGLSYETWAFVLWRPTLRDTRRTAGFKTLVRDLHLDAYWRSTGNWGDFCRPMGEADFTCQ